MLECEKKVLVKSEPALWNEFLALTISQKAMFTAHLWVNMTHSEHGAHFLKEVRSSLEEIESREG